MADVPEPAVRDRPGGARCGLSRLVADVDTLRDEHWDRMPLLTRASALPPVGDLFGSDAVDELLSVRGLRTPFVRMVKQGQTLPAAAYTLGGGVGASISDQVSEDKVLALFAEGASIVLQGLHRTWGPVISLSQAVAADLGHPVQVNAYVTPPSSRGFDVHYDVHDVFVLQVEGTKRWQLREPVVPHPLRDQPSASQPDLVAAAAETEPWLETDLGPGDCLYLPRGWLHSATALGGTSIHLTVGVHVWTVHHLLDELARAAVASLSAENDARASLPLGFDLDDPGELSGVLDTWLPRLVAALEKASPEDLVDAMRPKVRAAQRAEPVGALAQHMLGEQVPLRVRSHLAASWSDGVLVTRVGRLPVQPTDRADVETVLAGGDTSGLSAELRRRLVLAGILVSA